MITDGTRLSQSRSLCTPLDVLRHWPVDRRLIMLHSGRADRRWARWTIFGTPALTYRFDVRSRWIGQPAGALGEVRFTHDPLQDLDAILQATHADRADSDAAPFCGGWIGYFSYDLGQVIEPAARLHSATLERSGWPLIELAYCPSVWVFDSVAQTWNHGPPPLQANQVEPEGFDLGPMHSAIARDQYTSMVSRTLDYIRAGDIFQANIAQEFASSFSGSTRTLAHQAFTANQPWYGAYLELADYDSRRRRVLSLSPELFIQVDADSGQITTRPIKGTRPTSAPPGELLRSAKDAAELHMIVDLMRNDLGRICEYGSVNVPSAREIETHATVHHGVSEITGTLRRGTRFSDILRATFPGGSITGAPKIRAMQIIDELEPQQRGPYCGAIGFISNSGDITLNIAIRTMLVSGDIDPYRADLTSGTMSYSAGAGIVADSDPASEYRETLDKAAAVQRLCAREALAID